jgi:hypothetical protein
VDRALGVAATALTPTVPVTPECRSAFKPGRRLRPPAVYNLETQTDHVYHVSPLAVLAHNDCPGVPVQLTLDGKSLPSPRRFIVDKDGNAFELKPGESFVGSPDGKYIQVRGRDGKPTGLRKDGPHNPTTHKDPRALRPHCHVPGVTNPDGTPWLPVKY